MVTTKRVSPSKEANRKTAASAPSNAKLKELQKRLNKDPRLRKQFLKDPGPVLRRAGIELGAAKEQDIAKYTREVTRGPGQVFGAEVAMIRVGPRIRIRIMTRIGVAI